MPQEIHTVKSKKNGKSYFLNSKTQMMRGGRKMQLFYFSADKREDTGIPLPQGYEVTESEKTGLPLLRKKK